MQLSRLLDALPEKTVSKQHDASVAAVVHDSRLVGPGDVFVALRESSGNDGRAYIANAVERGAIAIVQEQVRPKPVPSAATDIRVPDTNAALAILSAHRYGYPSDSLSLIGVTGTNGKTSVCHMVESILMADKMHTGFVGTTGYRFDGNSLPEGPHHTTPYSDELQCLLRNMADQGAECVVMEVSSHALALERVAGMTFKIAAFTNLTQDHLDYHGSLNEYRDAKLSLFLNHLSEDGMGVVNLDDPVASDFIDASGARCVTYGRSSRAEISLGGLTTYGDGGMHITVSTPNGSIPLHVPLIGRYNEANILAAVAIAHSMGLKDSAIISGLANIAIPGRLESIDEGQPYRVIVDFAHTPDALESVLTALRPATEGRLIVVFGCGGDRDAEKRPMMGEIAANSADVVIVTSDNPRSENPESIIKDVVAGLGDKGSHSALVNRMDAIAKAFAVARKGDTVLLAGKGDELFQYIGDQHIEFDDREVARTLLQRVIIESGV